MYNNKQSINMRTTLKNENKNRTTHHSYSFRQVMLYNNDT